jgi:hypothetical protein
MRLREKRAGVRRAYSHEDLANFHEFADNPVENPPGASPSTPL